VKIHDTSESFRMNTVEADSPCTRTMLS